VPKGQPVGGRDQAKGRAIDGTRDPMTSAGIGPGILISTDGTVVKAAQVVRVCGTR
jgi:hypothetical protein